MGIGRQFKRLLTALEPDDAEIREAEAHARSIEARLSDAFDVRKFEIVGSHDRGSGIAQWSDVDYFAVISRDDARWGGSYVLSSTVLTRVRDELAARFRATDVRRDGPAVVVRFGGGAFPVDVVPAIYSGPHESGWPIYDIADGDGDWMPTSPGYHNAFIREADESSDGRLHRVARLLKLWRECRTPRIPISSFYMETVLAAETVCEQHTKTRQCLAAAFTALHDLDAEPVEDPLQICDEIQATRTEAQLTGVSAALERAADWAEQAIEAEEDGDDDEACRRWDQVFNGAFLS